MGSAPKRRGQPWGLDDALSPDVYLSTARRMMGPRALGGGEAAAVRVGGLSSAALAGSSAEARLHAGPPEKGGPDASSAEPPMPAQIDSVSGIIWEDYGRRSNEAKEPIRRSVAPLAVPPWQRDPEPPVWLSSNNLAGNAVNNPVYAGVRKAPVAGHNSGAISLLQGGSGRLFTPEGHLYTAEAKATSLNSLKPQPDGSGHLNDVIFADYGQTPDVEVARVNFSRPGKRTTSHSSRMRGTSFDFIGNNYQPERPKYGRRSVDPYQAALGSGFGRRVEDRLGPSWRAQKDVDNAMCN